MTVGAIPSITKALLPPRDAATPKAGRVKLALSPPLSLIVPPVREVVARYSRSELSSPVLTVYLKVRVSVVLPLWYVAN